MEAKRDRHGICILLSMYAAALSRRGSTGLLHYRDAEGNVSERRIRVLESYGGRGGLRYIKAFCHLKGEERTFRADRVVSFRPDPAAAAEPARPVPSRPLASTALASCLPPGAEAARAAELRAAPAAQASSSVPERSLVARIFGAAAWLFGRAYLLALVILFGISLVRGAGNLVMKIGGFRERNNLALVLPRYVPPRPAAVSVPKPAARDAVRPAPPSPAPRVPTAADFRAAAFAAKTGIRDPRLLRLYEDADLDGDGGISWKEVSSFQKDLKRKFAYKRNSTALRPDEFLRQGGGDCEDWALVTCGLLRYWGIESCVGTFGRPDGAEGHAVCMVWVPERPRDMTAYEEKSRTTAQGTRIPDGFYVPVDYEVVGGLSDAVVPGAVFRAYLEPEMLYGLAM